MMEKIKEEEWSAEFLHTTRQDDVLNIPDSGRTEAPVGEVTAGIDETAGEEGNFFISQKRSKQDFVLVRELSSCTYSIIHYVEVGGKVLQMEIRFIPNTYESAIIRRRRKLCSEGLHVDLEPVSPEEYRRFERVVRQHLHSRVISGKISEKPSPQKKWSWLLHNPI